MSDQPPEECAGTIRAGEYHPAANAAMAYMQSISVKDRFILLESFSSVALSGNRLAEICAETMNRLIHSKPVSDRYLLGLAWVVRDMQETKKDE